MNEHVVSYRESGHPDGMIAFLQPHPSGSVDWEADGQTVEPGLPCSAIAEVSNARCGKREAVVSLTARSMYTAKGSGEIVLPLCGGHFISHRAGKQIRVVVTPGKLR